ncbi:Fc.00g046410.m01.CDS01 [Cosmosporella sp. VM-42]
MLPKVSDFEDLDREVRAMLEAMLCQSHKWEVFCDAFAMCVSSLYIMYGPYLQPDVRIASPLEANLSGENTQNTEKALAAITFSTNFIIDLAINFNNHLKEHPEWLANLAPPAALTCFQAAEKMISLEDIIEDTGEAFAEIYKALETFSMRWKIGRTLLARLNERPNAEGVARHVHIDSFSPETIE